MMFHQLQMQFLIQLISLLKHLFLRMIPVIILHMKALRWTYRQINNFYVFVAFLGDILHFMSKSTRIKYKI
jgi:hypothetical protein